MDDQDESFRICTYSTVFHKAQTQLKPSSKVVSQALLSLASSPSSPKKDKDHHQPPLVILVGVTTESDLDLTGNASTGDRSSIAAGLSHGMI